MASKLLAEPTQKLDVDLKVLETHLHDLLKYGQETHESLFMDIPTFWKWYRAEPEHRVRNTPFQNASNMVYPLIRTHVDQTHAQRYDSHTATKDVWTHDSENEDTDEGDNMGRQVARFLNDEGSSRGTFDLSGVIYDVTRESELLNESVFRLRWGPKEKFRFGPSRGGKPRLRKVRVSHGPHLEHIPRQNVMWQPGCSVNESPWVIRMAPFHRAEIEHMAENMNWEKDAVSRLLKTNPELPALNGQFQSDGMGPVAASRMFAPYQIFEVLVEFPMTRGVKPLQDPDSKAGTYPPILAWLDSEGHLLYVGTYPYPTEGWNYYQFSRAGGSNVTHEQGLGELLEHFQAGITTMLNQGVDAITLHNNILGFTRDPRLVGKPIVPGQFTLLEDLEGVRMDLRPPNVIQPNVQIIQVLFAGAERLTGVSDPGFGRESRLGGHPSPATNLIAMLEQGSLKLKVTLKRDRAELSRLGNDLKSFYESYGQDVFDPQKMARRYGQADAAALTQWLTQEDLPDFTLQAIDDEINPEAAFQKQVLIDQLAASYIARVLEAMQNIPQAAQQFPELAQALAQAITIFNESYTRILETANIDDPEKFKIRIQGLEEASRQSVQRVTETASSALASLSAANPGLDLPGVSGGVPE